jgi:hypothetical protein
MSDEVDKDALQSDVHIPQAIRSSEGTKEDDQNMTGKKRNPFKLRDFRGIDPAVVETLATRRIRNADQMLVAGRTKEQRSALARETGIPEQGILELVKLSDLARLPGVKGIRARLYYAAGVDTVAKMAAWEPEPLRLMVTEYVERTGFDGIPPLPKEVSSTIENARRLPKVVEYE